MNATADIDPLAGVLPLASIIPFPDLLLGSVLPVAVVLIHGIGIRLVSVHFRKRSDALARRTRPDDPARFRLRRRAGSSRRSIGCAIGRR